MQPNCSDNNNNMNDKYSRAGQIFTSCQGRRPLQQRLLYLHKLFNAASALFDCLLPAIVVMLLPACVFGVADVRAPNIEIDSNFVMSLKCAVMTWTCPGIDS
jgi:hypothetical protein